LGFVVLWVRVNDSGRYFWERDEIRFSDDSCCRGDE
jgi:hypothetical protein